MSLSASFLPQGYLVSSYQLLEEVYLMFEDLHLKVFKKKSESVQTEGRHFRSTICKVNDV